MKNMKKILALLVAVLMLLGMVAAFAADDSTPVTKTITLTGGKAGHTYTLYQVFTGTVDNDELTNIQWGSGVTATFKATKDTAAAYAKEIADANDARATAQALLAANALTDGTTQTLTEDGTVTFSGLAEGYYVVVDTNTNEDVVEGDYSSALIVQVVKNVNMALKGSAPTSEKKVQDVNDSDSSVDTAGNWQDSADYDIGDAVPFKITSTTTDNVAAYKKYHITIQDTQSAGLNAPASFNIAVLGEQFTLANEANTSDTKTTEAGTKITVAKVAAAQGKTFAIKVTFEPTGDDTYLNAECNTTAIVVTYTSELNENAEIGSTGNPNTSYITYSNNPEDDDDSDEGKTPDDKVIVFTYKTVVDKVDQDGNDLYGAEFTLYKVLSSYTLPTTGTNAEKNAAIAGAASNIIATKVISDATNKNNNQFSFEGLDDGTYVLCETVTPTGYNTMAPVLFTISATHETTSDDPQLLTLTATDPFTDDNKDSGTVQRTKEGTTHARESGEAYAEIINNSGAELPSTGGIGTTLFYIGGGILVLAAVILLVTKRRMNAND